MLELSKQNLQKKHKISLETHLKNWVDPDINWSNHLKSLRNQGIIGDELRKRVGYLIALSSNSSFDIHKKIGVLINGNKWPSYNEKEWNIYLDQLEKSLFEIKALHKKLLSIPYIQPKDINKEAKTMHVWSWLIASQWGIKNEQAIAIVALYGERLLNTFISSKNKYYGKKGLFNFLIELNNWCNHNNIDPVKVKENESNSLQKYYRETE